MDQLNKIVRQNFGGQAYGDTFDALYQDEWEFDGQGDGFFFPAVVGELPAGSLGVEGDIQGEFGEAPFDITGRGGAVAGAHITPVALAIDEQVALAHIDEGIADGGIAVRVKLHGVADDVGHLVVAAIVELVHGMQDTPLYRFETIFDGGDGPFQDNIRGIIEEIILIHTL